MLRDIQHPAGISAEDVVGAFYPIEFPSGVGQGFENFIEGNVPVMLSGQDFLQGLFQSGHGRRVAQKSVQCKCFRVRSGGPLQQRDGVSRIIYVFRSSEFQNIRKCPIP